MGTTLMPNLTLLIGENSVAAHTTFSVRPPSLVLRSSNRSIYFAA